MNPRNTYHSVLLILAVCTAGALAPTTPTAPVERPPRPRLALLELAIVDDDGSAIPGATITARPMGGGKDAVAAVAITRSMGHCALAIPGGVPHVVTASLEGFDPVRVVGVELAGGFVYQSPGLAIGVSEGKPRVHSWSNLFNPVSPDEDSKFAEWLREQPDEVEPALRRAAGVRVFPLLRDVEVILDLTLGDWDQLAGASVAVVDEERTVFTALNAYGRCRVILDRPGTYTIRVQHPSIGTHQVTGVELLARHSYNVSASLESKQTTWTQLIADGEAHAMTFAGERLALKHD